MFVQNFKILGEVVPENFLTKISILTHIHYLGVREKKGKIEKEGNIYSQSLGFVFSNTLTCPHCLDKI